MKNKLVLISFIVMLALSVNVYAEPDNPAMPVSQNAEETLNKNAEENTPEHNLDEDTADNDLTIDENQNNGQADTYKHPISKKQLAIKFLLAMLGVGISSLMLYVILSIYNHIRSGIAGEVKTPDGNVSLDIPNNMESAVRTFLEKTKWN